MHKEPQLLKKYVEKKIVFISTILLYALLGSVFLSVLFLISSKVFSILFGFLLCLHVLFSLYVIARYGLFARLKFVSIGQRRFEIPPRFVIVDAKNNKIAIILSLASELFLGLYIII